MAVFAPVFLSVLVSGDVITLASGRASNPAPLEHVPWRRDPSTTTPPPSGFPRGTGFIVPGGGVGGGSDVASAARSPRAGPNWAPWSAWSGCSSQCLRGESQARHRACLDAEGSTAAEIKPCIERGRKANVDIRLCACNRYDEHSCADPLLLTLLSEILHCKVS